MLEFVLIMNILLFDGELYLKEMETHYSEASCKASIDRYEEVASYAIPLNEIESVEFQCIEFKFDKIKI